MRIFLRLLILTFVCSLSLSAALEQTPGSSITNKQPQQQQQQQPLSSNLDSQGKSLTASSSGSGSSLSQSNTGSSNIIEHSSSKPSSASSQSVVGGSSVQLAPNPLHYFYYPAKDTSSSSSGSSSNNNKDILSNAASNNNYQSSAMYPSYADQFNSAISSMINSAANPEPAASSQDPSYLPQPDGSQQQQQQPQPQMYAQQGNQNGQQHQAQAHQQSYNGDLGAYSSNLMPSQNIQPANNIQSPPPQQHQQQQQPGSVSFPNNSPSGSGLSAIGAPSNDYMNPHPTNHNQQQQASGPINAGYHSSLYSQLGDLSTSNFGNNAGGLSSVASYMSPNQQDLHSQSTNAANQLLQQQQQQQQQQHDFSNLLSGQQFSSAASQLNPAAVSPPNQLQANSLLNAASSLFGGANNNQQQQQQQQQQQNNLFANQHYLNSFLNPQQYSQLASAGNDQLMAQASNSMGQQNSMLAPVSSASTATTTSGSGKRFGMGSLVMPMLALAGLSLLIPTFSNLQSVVGRKKRSLDERAHTRQQQVLSFSDFNSPAILNGPSQMAKELSIGEYMDKIERYYSIYKNAVENDDCLNRLICEFGDAVKDVTGKSAVVTVIEKLVPTWMTGKMHLFKEAALNNKEGKEKCKKYICHSNKHQ